jgi:cyclic peptide transporter
MVAGIAFAQRLANDSLWREADKEIKQLMRAGNIPGLSMVLIQNGRSVIRNYGYANLQDKKPVTQQTLFELGSCTKAFTALAVMTLVQQQLIGLDQPVAKYIPWWKVAYKGTAPLITIRQLLHHTSGIPWSTISKIPASNAPDALELTVKQLIGQELEHLPGTKYEYATINYDVLAFVIETITHQPYEVYVQQQIINKLQLTQTTIGHVANIQLKATGYKIGFFHPTAYEAPVFKGNYAAGYVISNIDDLSRWLQFQMGLLNTDLYSLAQITHQRDETVPLHGMASYAMGWETSLSGNGEVFHDGRNPNYTAYIAFRPKAGIGIALMANSNSNYTKTIGNKLIKLFAGDEIKKEYDPGDGNDKAFSMLSIIMMAYNLLVIAWLVMIGLDIKKKKRRFQPWGFGQLRKALLFPLALLPFLYGLYWLPAALYEFTWESILVWTPVSFTVAVQLILVALGLSYIAYLAGMFFPGTDKFKSIIPRLLLLSILSGVANMAVIVLITSSIDSEVELKYLVFYYLLTIGLYLLGRRFVQVNLVRVTMEIIYNLRVQLVDKILHTSYQKFEQIDRGRVYTTLNDDVGTIGESANMLVLLITSFFTAAGAFLYLSFIAFWATVLTVGLILTLTTLYFFVSRSTNKYYEEARDTRNVFMRLINGMMDGYKEISLQKNKREAFKTDVTESAGAYRNKMTTASVRFVNASIVGETVLIALLGTVAFAFPTLFPGIKSYTLMSFIIVMLYLIGPVNTIMSYIPAVMRLRIAWRRIQGFLKDIPVPVVAKNNLYLPVIPVVNQFRAEGLKFQYKNGNGQHAFMVGPINLEVKRGEIIFIIGANGSGKTTLAKLLTGLYTPDQGRFTVNGQPIDPAQIGEHFSAIFSPVHLFEKLYNVDTDHRSEDIKRFLKRLHLEQKVEISNNKYSTIQLSGGQRKRLALLQCYLEDAPIFLFDEWAADQDPEYRLFFYRTLLPEMKNAGKVIIAITHDDHYFDVADKVWKMDQGKLLPYEPSYFSTAQPVAGIS